MSGARKSSDERKSELIEAARAVAVAEGLENVTGRKVATKAGLSSGLVFFHFENRAALLQAVLDSLIEDIFGNLVVPESDEAPEQRLMNFLRERIERLRKERRQIELFVDFWVLGVREPEIRKRIRKGLEAYRAAMLPITTVVAGTRDGMTGDGLAQLAVSFILGCALQVGMDTGAVDTEAYLGSVSALFLTPKKKAKS